MTGRRTTVDSDGKGSHANDGWTRWLNDVGEWKLALTTLLLVLVYVIRHTGGLPGSTGDVADEVMIAAAMLLSLSAAGVRRLVWNWHLAIACTVVVVSIAGAASSGASIATVSDLLGGYMLVVIIISQTSIVVSHRRVSGDTLFGAAGIYLSIGILFGILYSVAAVNDPTVFQPPQVVADGVTKLYYFSFVTLTSLGYGDVSPTGDVVQILATLEAVIGVIALAALVGRIVGVQIAQETSSIADEQQTLIEEVRSLEVESPTPGLGEQDVIDDSHSS